MIVVGAHGAGEARQPALGRTADWLVQHADRPVVVVPESP
jgi:nucleotide-binding universal stress UspA family protein